MMYPSGHSVEYNYDVFNRLISVKDNQDTTVYSYNAMDDVETIENKAQKSDYTYNELGLIQTQVTHNKVNNTTSVSLSYQYNEKGNLIEERNNLENTLKTYEYDAWDQIVKEDNQGTLTTYQYDNKGNRTHETINDVTKRYSYNGSNQLLKVTNPLGHDITYTYDARGNVIRKVYDNGYDETYSYNGRNQLITIKNSDERTIKMDYDAEGHRFRKTDTYTYDSIVLGNNPNVPALSHREAIERSKKAYEDSWQYETSCTFTLKQDNTTTHTTEYVNDVVTEFAQVVETYKNNAYESSNIFGHDLIMRQKSNKNEIAITNRKHDIIGVLSGNEEIDYDYDLFGKPISATIPDLGYSGESHEGGLQYLRARYYDTETGVFISRDTYAGASDNLQSQNRYAYVQNNPVNAIDPSGHVMLLDTGDGRVVSDYDLGINPRDRSASIEELKKKEEKAKQILESLQTTLNKKENEWRKAGLSESEIDAMRLDFVRKYCEELGLDSVETRLVLEKIEEAQKKGNKLGNQGQQKADKPWYERALDAIVDGWNFVTNWVSNNWGLILTGLSVVATVAGLIALGVATGGTGLAILGLTGMSAETAIAVLNFAALSGMVSTILQAVKSLFNQPMNEWDFAVNVGNMIIARGVQIGYALVQVGIYYGVYTSGGGASPDPIPGDKGTGNLDTPVNENDLKHVFENPTHEHNLHDYLDSFNGNQTQAYNAVQQAGQTYTSSNPYVTGSDFIVNVNGFDITVRGNIVEGIFRIGTFFIP